MKQESFEEFEKKILDEKITGKIKYSVDRNTEASVKFQFLCESYGQDKVQLAMNKMGIEFIDLSEILIFEQLSKNISKKSIDDKTEL